MTASHKRGNATRSVIRKHYPHQVALPQSFCSQENFWIIERFLERFSDRPKMQHVQAVWPNRKYEDYRLYCFSNRTDAEVFAAHFEGTHFDPHRDREGGKVLGCWRRTGEWTPTVRCGPLELPVFFQKNP